MKKTALGTVVTVLAFAVVHVLMCLIYDYTYYSAEFGFSERYTGIVYWALLICAFLAGPFVYYVVGRNRKGRGNKKVVLGTITIMNVLVTVLGIVALFDNSLSESFKLMNSPSYMYYMLFADSVLYISVPALLITSMFPAFFFKLGYTKKPRTNNEIKMEELNGSADDKDLSA